MAHRKGVKSLQKWATDDGEEFDSPRAANDHQGALNTLRDHFQGFWEDRKESHDLTDEKLRSILFAWERYKNANPAKGDPETHNLIPDEGVKAIDPEPSSAIDTSWKGVTAADPKPDPKSDTKKK